VTRGRTVTRLRQAYSPRRPECDPGNGDAREPEQEQAADREQPPLGATATFRC